MKKLQITFNSPVILEIESDIQKQKRPAAKPIKVKEDPKATILKHASDDVLALAIRDMMKKK